MKSMWSPYLFFTRHFSKVQPVVNYDKFPVCAKFTGDKHDDAVS